MDVEADEETGDFGIPFLEVQALSGLVIVIICGPWTDRLPYQDQRKLDWNSQGTNQSPQIEFTRKCRTFGKFSTFSPDAMKLIWKKRN